MAAQKLTPQQQRDRRSKIMLGVLGVVFIGVLGLQLPKLMGGSGGPPPPSATPIASAIPTAGGAGLASATAPASGQLLRFTRFAAKDPFAAKVKLSAGGPAPATGTTAPSSPAPAPAKPPAPKPKPAPPKTTTTPTVTFSMTQQPAKPAAPVGPQVPAVLLIVNGKKQVVTLDGGFPKRGPLFRVVALGEKTIWIRLIGGSLQDGSTTLKLVRGRKITLVNTTAGKKYVLSLVKLTTAPAPPTPPAKPAAPATTTSTSTTQTSPTVTLPVGSSSG